MVRVRSRSSYGDDVAFVLVAGGSRRSVVVTMSLPGQKPRPQPMFPVFR